MRVSQRLTTSYFSSNLRVFCRICRLLDVLDLCATQFKYKEVQTSETKAAAVPSKPDSSTAKARLEEAILAKGAAREMMARHRESRFLSGESVQYSTIYWYHLELLKLRGIPE